MKDSRGADVETAIATGITTGVLLETGIIAPGGVISGFVAELGATSVPPQLYLYK